MSSVDPVTLQMNLNALLDMIYSGVVGVSADVASKTKNPAVREYALQWKIRSTGFIREVQIEPDPRRAFVAIWVAGVQQRLFFTTGFGKDAFGDQQQLVVDALTRFETEIERFAHNKFPNAPVDEITEEIEHYISLGLAGHDFIGDKPVLPVNETEDSDAMYSILTLPMAPFAGMRGIGNTPAEIRRFSVLAESYGQLISDMPEQLRWQVEQLMYEAQALDSVQGFLAETKKLQENSEQVLEITKKLPEDLGNSLNNSLTVARDDLHGLVDTIFWRAVILVGIIFAAAFVFRLIAPRRR